MEVYRCDFYNEKDCLGYRFYTSAYNMEMARQIADHMRETMGYKFMDINKVKQL